MKAYFGLAGSFMDDCVFPFFANLTPLFCGQIKILIFLKIPDLHIH